MPTYKQVVNHVKKHVLWKEEYFERYYRLNPELVQKRLDKIYQAKDDLMVLISTQLFCFLQANGTLYFDGCYKIGKADNSLLCTNLALWSIELACDHLIFGKSGDIPRSLASRERVG
ncbi:putative cytoplasmic protein [Salmonella enterica subsp. enterica]|uniref:Putative cytoplasmic protein n=1 Tax=Salmonella enterica I TaxID=59201 RepID=A0A379WA22_SALET|nr:putative cytoplasmic protein [Salmonella enterica subsp. enterica]